MGHWGVLEYGGSVDSISGAAQSSGVIVSTDLGDVGNVETSGYAFITFEAENLGDVDGEAVFNAASLQQLEISGDVNNVQFFSNGHGNRYGQINVGGVITDSEFFGSSIGRLLVSNNDGLDVAIEGSTFDCRTSRGSLGQLEIAQGDVVDSIFLAGSRIDNLEVSNGNLDGCTRRGPRQWQQGEHSTGVASFGQRC